MGEHKVCKGCQHNNYPICKGTIMFDGNEMNIEKLKFNFRCGQKDDSNITDFSVKYKSEADLKIEELEEKIKLIEERLLLG